MCNPSLSMGCARDQAESVARDCARDERPECSWESPGSCARDERPECSWESPGIAPVTAPGTAPGTLPGDSQSLEKESGRC